VQGELDLETKQTLLKGLRESLQNDPEAIKLKQLFPVNPVDFKSSAFRSTPSRRGSGGGNGSVKSRNIIPQNSASLNSTLASTTTISPGETLVPIRESSSENNNQPSNNPSFNKTPAHSQTSRLENLDLKQVTLLIIMSLIIFSSSKKLISAIDRYMFPDSMLFQ
jgi:hypothetical protein